MARLHRSAPHDLLRPAPIRGCSPSAGCAGLGGRNAEGRPAEDTIDFVLPLAARTLRLLRRYLQVGRADSDLPQLFLRIRSPIHAMNHDGIIEIFNYRAARSGLPLDGASTGGRGVGRRLALRLVPASRCLRCWVRQPYTVGETKGAQIAPICGCREVAHQARGAPRACRTS